MQGQGHKLTKNAGNTDRRSSSHCAAQAPESEKLKEIVQLQTRLWHTVQKLPAGAERKNAICEIIGFKHRMTGLIRRRWQRQ